MAYLRIKIIRAAGGFSKDKYVTLDEKTARALISRDIAELAPLPEVAATNTGAQATPPAPKKSEVEEDTLDNPAPAPELPAALTKEPNEKKAVATAPNNRAMTAKKSVGRPRGSTKKNEYEVKALHAKEVEQ